MKPVNKNIPKSTLEWGKIYGKANAAAFDTMGWSYYSRESFDLFYPGYGDSWPSLNGAIGMTYEQAGGAGVRVKRTDEAILTLKDRIDHHTTTSWATLRATAENREKRLRDFYDFFKQAIAEGKTGPIRAFIIPPGSDPNRTGKMIRLLRNQGVEIYQAEKEFSLDGLDTYFAPKKVSRHFAAGSYILPLDQPAKRLITALMEQEPALTDTFFYDISTWTLPVAYGVEAYWTGKALSVPLVKLDSVKEPPGLLHGGKASYAYLLKWNSNDAARALAWLLQNDYKASVAMKPFEINREKFGRGTIIIPVHRNKVDLHDRLQELAGKFHVDFYGVQSGSTEAGIDLGSDRVVSLKKPRIVVLAGSPVASAAYGAIWALLDEQYGVEFVPMKLEQLRSADLREYTAIVLPDDNAEGNDFKSHIDSILVQKIKTWVSGGGTLIAIDGGAAFASAAMAKIATVKIKEKKKPGEPEPGAQQKDAKQDTAAAAKKEEKVQDELEKMMTVEQRERKRRLESIPGTILRVRLDNSHPLGFGYDSLIAVLKKTKTIYELSDNGYNVGIYTKSPRLSGYLSKENERRLEETPFLVHEKLGSGNVVLFGADPNFRLFWEGLNKLFLNALLLTPSIRNVALTAD